MSKAKIDSHSLEAILKKSIDTSLSFDPALNQGDTLYLDLPDFNPKIITRVISYMQERNRYQIVQADLESVIKRDPVSPHHPTIRCEVFVDKTTGTGTVVISTHGLIKTTDKTPPGEIEKAGRLRESYFEDKSK